MGAVFRDKSSYRLTETANVEWNIRGKQHEKDLLFVVNDGSTAKAELECIEQAGRESRRGGREGIYDRGAKWAFGFGRWRVVEMEWGLLLWRDEME